MIPNQSEVWNAGVGFENSLHRTSVLPPWVVCVRFDKPASGPHRHLGAAVIGLCRAIGVTRGVAIFHVQDPTEIDGVRDYLMAPSRNAGLRILVLTTYRHDVASIKNASSVDILMNPPPRQPPQPKTI